MKKNVPSEDVTSNEYKCVHCQKVFKHNSSLSRHKLVCGNDAPSYDCKTCDRTFDRADTLKRLVNVSGCKGKEKKIFRCDRCDSKFDYQWFLTRHHKSCVDKCKNCRKKIKDGDDHICRGLLVKLPKNRLKGVNKRAEMSSLEYEQQLNLAELATLLNFGDASSDREKPIEGDISQAQAAPDSQHVIAECLYCFPLLPGSADHCLQCSNPDAVEFARTVYDVPYSCQHCSGTNPVDFRIDCVPGNDDVPAADLAVALLNEVRLFLVTHGGGPMVLTVSVS